ncbi:MAG TPA: LCP family protein [Streptosporangiaceae bacterium]|jgi:LCP family protein required for cell wall assembly|nr:LCP family protein [Streptosporangiaceae bacterium]
MDPAEPEDPGSLKNDGPGAPRSADPGSVQSTGRGLLPDAPPAATSTKTEPDGKSPHGASPDREDPHAKRPDSKGPDSKGPDGKDPHTKGPGGKKPGGRRRKILAWTAATLAVIVVVGVLGAYLVYRHLNGNLHQVDISGVLGSQPVSLHPEAQNILVLGSDTRHGQARRYGRSAVLNTDHSDTLIIVHIAANREWANIMSIPRDSWVSIPACRMGNGQMSSPTTFKINEAFTLGTVDGNKTELGVACTVKTIEKDTGIRMDHFVVVNFAGFRDMVRAVGGVPECNTRPINDPKSGLHLTAGHHLLNGSQALGYVRARYTLGNGSDLERISRQQAFMSSLVDRVKSKLLNPVAIYRFLDAATKSITIDSGLGGIKGLYDLATSLKNLPPSQVTFFTLPTYPRSYVDPTDTANVMWTQPEDSKIFQAFRNDVPVSKDLLKRQPPPRIAPRKVTLDVLNGSGAGGLEYTVAAVLEQDGFKVKRTGNASSHNVTQTLIEYHAGQLPEARLLAAKVHGSALQEVPGTGKITLLLGSNYGSTAHTGPGTKPQPASSFAPRTASQNICT